MSSKYIMDSSKKSYYLFFKKMTIDFGIKFKTIFYEMKKLLKTIAQLEFRIYYWNFLKVNDILPTFCQVKNKSLRQNNLYETKKFEKKIFQKHIEINKQTLLINKKNLYQLKNLYINNFTEYDVIITFYHLNNYKKYLDHQSSKIFKKRRTFLKQKYTLPWWGGRKNNNQEITKKQDTKGFINLSKTKLELDELQLLNLGPKSTLEPNTSKFEDIKYKTDIEMISRKIIMNHYNDLNLQNLNSEQKQSLNFFNTSINKEIKNSKNKKRENTEEGKLIKEIELKIKENNLIMILADKSNTMVLLEKDIYIEKMEIALIKNNFLKVDYNHTERNERTLQALLRTALNEKIMDYNTYKTIYPSTSPPAIIYGKIKTHKSTLDIRPIVDTRFSYVSGASTWLIQKLNKYVNKKYSIKNSTMLKEDLKHLEIKENYFMISLDVESMYGSVDLQSVFDYILTRYQFDSNKPFKLGKNGLDFLNEMLNICTRDVCCTFNNSNYIQQNGCGMGLNLSPMLSEIQMWIIENKLMNTVGVGRGKDAFVITYRRFVDDLFFIISHPKHINTLLEVANNISPNIKFTMETEKSRLLNFLDITLIRTPTSLEFTIFRKKTQNTLRINYFSHYEKKIVINNLKQEITRAYKICSTEKLLMIELKTITEIYLNNNYPKGLIIYHINLINSNYCTNINLGKLKTLSNSSKNTNQQKTYLALESDQFSDLISKHYKKLENNICWNNDRKLLLLKRTPNTLEKIFLHINADGINIQLRKFIIYLYQCDCSSTYIGNSLRSLRVRAAEHSKQNNSQINLHTISTGHAIDLNNFSILMHQQNTMKRFIMERYMIEKMHANLNVEKGISLITEQI